MSHSDFWTFISVALTCAVSLTKAGIPAVIIAYKSNYLLALTCSITGALFGTITFTYLSAGILKWWDKIKERWFKSKHPKKIFTKSNRRIIRVKHRFGLTGIAIITPVLLSIPIGAFLAERFYKDKKKVILYLGVSAVAWSVILYFSFLFFYNSFKSWFA